MTKGGGIVVTVNYVCKWRLRDAPNYVFGKGKCFNVKTGRELKQVYNNGSIGYNINGRFRTLVSLRKCLEFIKPLDCPF